MPVPLRRADIGKFAIPLAAGQLVKYVCFKEDVGPAVGEKALIARSRLDLRYRPDDERLDV